MEQPEPETLGRLFFRFLKFGVLAFGGPVAQISLMHEELVERRRWVNEAQFNRALGVYQALPGPEATELAVYFGYIRRGRWGGLLAGLGFVLPGFLLMLAVAWAYAYYREALLDLGGWLFGFKAVVLGVILNALWRIGRRAFHAPPYLGLGIAALLVGLVWNVNLIWIALAGGLVGLLIGNRRREPFVPLSRGPAPGLLPVALWGASLSFWGAFAWFFLKAGLLTFGGAYAVIPFLEEGAVRDHGWVDESTFLDGIALGGLLPAPLIIVATFVGYQAAGLPGALLATTMIFLPAFLFTLALFRWVTRLVESPRLHPFFDGVTAAVVALIGVAAYRLAPAALPNPYAWGIALVGFGALRLRAHAALVIVGGGLAGALLHAAGAV